MSRTIWISGLVPTNGAEVYDGIRLAYSDTEAEAYADLNYWLADGGEGTNLGQDEEGFVAQVQDALNESSAVMYWNVESRELSEAAPKI